MSIHIDIIANRKYKPTILLRKAWHEGKNACSAILANLSRCTEYLVEALRTLLKGMLSFKTILMISESAESRKQEFKSLKINPRKYVVSKLKSPFFQMQGLLTF